MWEISDRSDTVPIDGRPVLSLEGLNRLCRHVIRRYVERASTEHDNTFDYREALPGVLTMQLAPEYWIWQADRVDAGDGPAMLNGFLEVLLPVLRGESSQLPVDLRDPLERIETRLPGEASAPKRGPLLGSTRCGIGYSRKSFTARTRTPFSPVSAVTSTSRARPGSRPS